MTVRRIGPSGSLQLDCRWNSEVDLARRQVPLRKFGGSARGCQATGGMVPADIVRHLNRGESEDSSERSGAAQQSD